MSKNIFIVIVYFTICTISSYSQELNLNGLWETGIDRNYDRKAETPGINTDPARFSAGTVWYKRSVRLPDGDWTYATLQLKGARFSPEVYVDGVSVSQKNGGMAPTFHLLKSENVRPANTIILEIALASLSNISESDASYIARADHWRSNISSYLWDDVILKFHKEIRIARLIPFYDINKKTVKLRYELEQIADMISPRSYSVNIGISDKQRGNLVQKECTECDLKGEIEIYYGDKLQLWTHLNPVLYNLNIQITDGERILDEDEINIGIREFEVKGKQFLLNNDPCKIGSGTVVWHRWSRNADESDIIYDTAWFVRNVIVPLKERGANTLRFHLGTPPERFLDLCDKYGLMVQYEWSFFHGMPASKESLTEQWRNWLDHGMKHPSAVLIHPYNETEGEQLKTAWNALDEILPEYPDLVMEDRDVLHVHKYWWSLFENLGLYYNSYNEFPKAIMVDEFGGNYLDGDSNMGLYTTVNETFLRFAGRGNTAEQRLYHHTISNSRVAEYWRRTGAAGFSPFCILGSREDGSNWYLGNTRNGKLKPVWNALTAAWSPKSVSLEIWDRNFIPGQRVVLPLYFFNDTRAEEDFEVRVSVEDAEGKEMTGQSLRKRLSSFSKEIDTFALILPLAEGKYTIKAELLNPTPQVKHHVISEWQVNVFNLKIDKQVRNLKIAIPSYETELLKFSAVNHLKRVRPGNRKADVVLLSSKTWNKIAQKDNETTSLIEKAVNSGVNVIMLDIGDKFLGQGYLDDDARLSFLQGRYQLSEKVDNKYDIGNGIELSFNRIAEPESHIHADKNNNMLWENIPPDHTWVWNGLRGGLIVPAANMKISGLSRPAFTTNWISKGAEENKIKGSGYYAYGLEGFYRFSQLPADQKIIKELKASVKFLVEDAPALKGSINPDAPVEITDLVSEYNASGKGSALNIEPLVNCGRNLIQTPVMKIDFGRGKGNLILSQLIMNDRLVDSGEAPGLYDIRYDVVTCQFLINMLKTVTGD